jgi:hypothetical protein
MNTGNFGAGEKRPYEAPRLTVIGTFESLTQSQSSGQAADCNFYTAHAIEFSDQSLSGPTQC